MYPNKYGARQPMRRPPLPHMPAPPATPTPDDHGYPWRRRPHRALCPATGTAPRRGTCQRTVFVPGSRRPVSDRCGAEVLAQALRKNRVLGFHALLELGQASLLRGSQTRVCRVFSYPHPNAISRAQRHIAGATPTAMGSPRAAQAIARHEYRCHEFIRVSAGLAPSPERIVRLLPLARVVGATPSDRRSRWWPLSCGEHACRAHRSGLDTARTAHRGPSRVAGTDRHRHRWRDFAGAGVPQYRYVSMVSASPHLYMAF